MAKPDLKTYRERMDKSVSALKEEFNGLRTGRANVGLLDPVQVQAYGSNAPLNSVAAISVPEPRMIQIKVWERGQSKAVDKAIREAELGFNPQVDGDLIRVPIPALTEERRKDIAKQARKAGEETKIAIRKNRKDAREMINQLVNDGDVPEDDGTKADKTCEDIVAAAVKTVDEIVAAKEKDIMTV